MRKFLLFLFSILIFNSGIAQGISGSNRNNMEDTIRHKWITSDTGYLPIVPTGPVLEMPLPNKAPQKPPQNKSGGFISLTNYSEPPEITHAHIPTSMVVDKTKNVGEITINSESTMGSTNYSIPFEMPQGRNGLTPSVNIVYGSGAGNSVLGYGWGIGGLSSIVSANFSDYYDGYTNSASLNQLHPFTLDGMRLIEVSNSGGVITYEPEQGNLRVKGYLAGSIVK